VFNVKEVLNLYASPAEAWVRLFTSACDACDGQSGTGTDFFFLLGSVFPFRYHSTDGPYSSSA